MTRLPFLFSYPCPPPILSPCSLKLTCPMLSELLENEVLSVAFYGEETVWNSRCVYVSLCVCVFWCQLETQQPSEWTYYDLQPVRWWDGPDTSSSCIISVCERVCMCVFDNVIKAPGENLFSIVVVISAVLIWTVTALLAPPAMMPWPLGNVNSIPTHTNLVGYTHAHTFLYIYYVHKRLGLICFPTLLYVTSKESV